MIYHVKWAKSCGHFAEAGRLLIYACRRIIQNYMSGPGISLYLVIQFEVGCSGFNVLGWWVFDRSKLILATMDAAVLIWHADTITVLFMGQVTIHMLSVTSPEAQSCSLMADITGLSGSMSPHLVFKSSLSSVPLVPCWTVLPTEL